MQGPEVVAFLLNLHTWKKIMFVFLVPDNGRKMFSRCIATINNNKWYILSINFL